MREAEAGHERLQRTQDRIDVRTAQAVDEIVAYETGADVVAAENEDIKIEAESIPVQPDEQMVAVQLEVGPEVRLQDGERRGTDTRFKLLSEKYNCKAARGAIATGDSVLQSETRPRKEGVTMIWTTGPR